MNAIIVFKKGFKKETLYKNKSVKVGMYGRFQFFNNK